MAQEQKEAQTSNEVQSRRGFVKAAALGGVGLAVGSLVSGCSKGIEQKEVIKGVSKKQEILHRSDTKYWQEYLAVAK